MLETIKNKRVQEKTYCAFGEIMLRLASPGFEKLFQSPVLQATFGGGEANVMVSLAMQGLGTRFISALPDNDIGAAALRMLKGHGVDTSFVKRMKGARMGIYFMEKGANQRPSKVIYDRHPSAVTSLARGDIDWNDAFNGCRWFHITGITPALSAEAAALSIEAVERARELGLVVSCDLNYRAKLWNYGKAAREVMGEIVKNTHIVIANEEDIQKSLGLGEGIDPTGGEIIEDRYRELIREVLDTYSSVSLVAVTLRESVSASHNRWGACIGDRQNVYFSRKYDITHIVDRVGAGDSFGAGLIYGLSRFDSRDEALEYAVAASCLTHSIEGDQNLSGHDEIMNLMKGEASGRIKR